MPLTRDFSATIKARAKNDEAFKRELIVEAAKDLDEPEMIDAILFALLASSTPDELIGRIWLLDEAEGERWKCDNRSRLTREALADVDAGRVIDHADVKTWTDSLGGAD